MRHGIGRQGNEDTAIGVLHEAGFSVEIAAHTFSVLDSYSYRFALQEASQPSDIAEQTAELAEAITAQFAAGQYPRLAKVTVMHVIQSDYDYGNQLRLRARADLGRGVVRT